MVLSLEEQPAVVVLTLERYNQIVAGAMPQVESKTANSNITMNKKVMVTGGAGYIGGHLVNELIKAGYEVVVLDNLSTGRRENINSKALFIEGDLADENLLWDIFAQHKFDAVFHMAASLEVEESVREPAKYFRNNVSNSINLLNVMEEVGCKKIIFSSTAAVYGVPEHSPVTENSPMRPNNPYGSSKLLVERILKYYSEYRGFQTTIFRYFNACGFDPELRILPTHQTHLIYNVMQVAKGAKPYLQVFGNDYKTFDGTCIRDYVHVLDIVLPHILALEKMNNESKFEIYNIGTGEGLSVAQVVNSASEVLNKIIPMEVGPRREGDAPETVADNAKLLHNLGYKPSHSSLENIMQTSWEVMKEM
jgi:UDP-glucose 4-epimerase